MKQIVVVLTSHGEKLSFKNDNLIVSDAEGKIKHQSTCYRLFALFIIGNITITSGRIERAEKFGFSIILMTQSLRVIGVWSSKTEGNVLLRKRQYEYQGFDIAQRLVANKIESQLVVMQSIREKSELLQSAIKNLKDYQSKLPHPSVQLKELLGIEGIASREYFKGIFEN